MSQLVTQALEIASLRSGDRARSIAELPGRLPDSGVEFRQVPDLAGALCRGPTGTGPPVSAFWKLPIDLR
jgi:hypothetical protein